MQRMILGGALGLGLAACATVPPGLMPSGWQVVSLAGRDLGADDRVTIDFAEGRVSGISGCNRYTGPVTVSEDGAIAFGLLATTRMACAGDPPEIEDAFVEAIGTVDRFQVVRGDLVLLAGDEAVIRAERD
ncbi:MAG: Heat shock protein [Rhodobacteraceae bacterium HLUCCA12]|nr:MAG: Heat shock protein [Rhodobacteraceae bacterium HLUCCA12]